MTRHESPRAGRSSRKFAVTLIVAGAMVSGCTDFAGYDLDYLIGRADVISTMRNTISYQPQDIALLPAEGTVPVAGPGADSPAPFTAMQLDSAAATLSNPLAASETVLARGEVVYNNQCSVCHGALGAGDGSVVGGGRFPTAPTLLAGTATGRSDGYLYAVIRAGRGLMPAYGERIDHEDRWAVVHYIRALQGQPAAAGATQVTDVAADPAQQSAAAPL